MTAGLKIERMQVTLRDGDRSFRLTLARLALSGGEAVALTGPSGSGKTLALELLGLLRAPDREPPALYSCTGAAEAPHDLGALWRRGARGRKLARARGRVFGFVPQSGGLVPFLTVAENIALPQRLTGRPDPALAATLIARLGLGDVAALHPGALSIGQRQRVAIARALAHRPPFVIADEPTAALDPDASDTVLALLLETASDEGCGVILSSHDLTRVGRLGITRLHLSTRSDGNGGVVSSLDAAPC